MPSFFSVCQSAAYDAGKILVERMGRVDVRKKGHADLVTEADFAAQEMIHRTVLEAFPDHALIGEEAQPGTDAAAGDAEYRWIVDPLDGTTNYVHGVPHFCVSLALERAGELVVGAVYNPMTDECFTAARGEGARLNGQLIRTSSVAELSEAMGAVGFPSVVYDDSPDLMMFQRALRRCQSLRRTGSAALNLSYVAAGRFDAAWLFSAHVWDVAAGVLLIREAGGVVTAPEGGEFVLDDARLIAAANGRLHADLVKLWASG